jgi:hypothetical protein
VTGGVLLISWFWFFAGGRKLCAAIPLTSQMLPCSPGSSLAERRYRGPRNVLAEEKQIHTVQKGDDLVEGKRDDLIEGKRDDDDSFGQ